LGGSASSRWRGYTPQPLVEHTPRLDFNSPPWRAVLKLPTASGTLDWTNANGARTATVAFELGPIEENRARTLVLSPQGSQGSVCVTLEATKVGFDKRWHTKCPLDCGRSIRSIFLLPDGQLGCRNCLGLVYLSSRKSDKRVDLCRRNPAEFIRGRSHLTTVRSHLVTSWIVLDAKSRGFRARAT
jgi:hypothetical protein